MKASEKLVSWQIYVSVLTGVHVCACVLIHRDWVKEGQGLGPGFLG